VGGIVRGFFLTPHLAIAALWRALSSGNLIWTLLLPLLALPLLRPRWWLIAAPLLLQHLLSWRPSEWSIGAHYPAPFIPLFWIAAAEVFPRLPRPRLVAAAIVLACLAGQVWVGPVRSLAREFPTIAEQIETRAWKAELLTRIPRDASVMAGVPYLSHLATRERLLSLHHTLKGLKTLSRATYETPAPTDAVFIDYEDHATFSTVAGYYHPRMRTADGREVPSSDRLLHEFLRQHEWRATSRHSVTLLLKGAHEPTAEPTSAPVKFDDTTTLLGVQSAGDPARLRLRLAWEFSGERQRFPWMMLVLHDGRALHPFVKGACAIEGAAGRWTEEWTLDLPASVPPGDYALHAVFYDAADARWQGRLPPADTTHVRQHLDLGRQRLAPLARD
jgi:Predicted membrane protein (DUF2079)